MSHEESDVNVSFDEFSEGTLPRNVHVVQGFYPRSFLDRISQLEDNLKRLGRYRWTRRPRAAERALQELDEILSAANAVLAGASGADTIFRQRVGSVPGGLAPDSSEARDAGRRAAVPQVPVLGGAFAFLSDFPCADRLAGALQVLQAGFAIDLAERHPEASWTSRARAYIDERTAVVDRYAESMRSDLNQQPGPPIRAGHGLAAGSASPPSPIFLAGQGDWFRPTVRERGRPHGLLPTAASGRWTPALRSWTFAWDSTRRWWPSRSTIT